MPRKKVEAPSPLNGRKARVSLERAGLSIVIDDVAAVESGVVAVELLRVFRVLGQKFGELREAPDVTPGGTPIEIPDEVGLWDEKKRKVGF